MDKLSPAKIQCEYCKRTVVLDDSQAYAGARHSPWALFICPDSGCRNKALDSIKIPVICEVENV